MKIPSQTKAKFDAEVLKSKLPVVVDFFAPWCGPCKILAPILEDLADKYADKITFAKVDTDVEEQLALDYNITSVPTTLVFVNGALEERIPGAIPKAKMDLLLKKYL